MDLKNNHFYKIISSESKIDYIIFIFNKIENDVYESVIFSSNCLLQSPRLTNVYTSGIDIYIEISYYQGMTTLEKLWKDNLFKGIWHNKYIFNEIIDKIAESYFGHFDNKI